MDVLGISWLNYEWAVVGVWANTCDVTGSGGPPNKLAPAEASKKSLGNRQASNHTLDPFQIQPPQQRTMQMIKQEMSDTKTLTVNLQASQFGAATEFVKEEVVMTSSSDVVKDELGVVKTEPYVNTALDTISPNKSGGVVKASPNKSVDSTTPSKGDDCKSAAATSATASSSSPGGEAAAVPQVTTPGVTTRVNGKPVIKFPAEYLRDKLIGTFETVKNDPDAWAFQTPVDPDELHLPDYFKIVKRPMDLSTIRKKLCDECAYSNPQEFVDDMWLMFNNAWLFNKKTSKVYKNTTKLSEIFAACIDPVMREMGYCCGQQYSFSPQVLFCYGNQMCCTIPRDAGYYLYNNTDVNRPNVNCDKYTFCIKCFESVKAETIGIGDDPAQPLFEVKKSLFVQMKNDHEEPEAFVDCTECGRKWHVICALHMDQTTTKFVCETCVRERGLVHFRRDARFAAAKLMRTQLGDFLEQRVNSFLKAATDENPYYKSQAGRVTIRILSAVDKVCEVKPMMKQRFEGEITEQFPFRTKAIFAFEEIDGTDVVFFGMHVQEYGSESAPPNTRRVYISYLDSVFFFRPKELRTNVYHEILIGFATLDP